MKLVLILMLFITKSNALAEQLKIPPAEIVYACSGDTAIFPWNSNNKTQPTTDVKWFYRMKNGLHKMVAFYANKMFLPADHRLRPLADNRLSLVDVQVPDTGLYYVEAKYTDNTRFNFTFYLQVSNSPMVKDQQLQVTQDSVALWNKTSSQWAIRLLCGTFTFQGNHAPIQVEWILPDGMTRVSKDYEKGHFYLTLSAPVKADMKYTCRIPRRYYPNICLTGKTKAYALTEASLFVEEDKTKLIMIEAEQERVKNTVDNLISAFTAQDKDLRTSDDRLKNAVDKLNSNVVAKEQQFRASDDRLKNAVDKLNSSVVAKEKQFRTSDERLKNAVDKLNSIVVAQEKGFRTSDERLKNAVDKLNSSVIAKEKQFKTSEERLKNAVDRLNSSVVAKEEQFRASHEGLKNDVDKLNSMVVYILPKMCWPGNHIVINDTRGHRDVSYSATHEICDSNLRNDSWYRVYMQGKIADVATSCPKNSELCGTKAAMWLNVTQQGLPKQLGQEVQVTACISYKTTCCRWSIQGVAVVNCGQFFVYKLKPNHRCHSAYCFQRH